MEKLVNKIIEDVQNSTPIRPVDPSADVVRIQENFAELQDKLAFFKSQILALEKKSASIFEEFAGEKTTATGSGFDQLDLFRDVNQDIHKMLLNFNNAHSIVTGRALGVFGHTSRPSPDRIIEESTVPESGSAGVSPRGSLEEPQRSMVDQLKIEDRFHLTVGSLVQVQNNLVNKCLLYHMFEVSKLMKYLGHFKAVFLGGNGRIGRELAGTLFSKNGRLKLSGLESFKSNLEDIVYRDLEARIQKTKVDFMRFQMQKTRSNERAQAFRERISKMEAKKWLRAEFRPTGRLLEAGEQCFDLFGSDCLEARGTYSDFKRFFFSSDILSFYLNVFFEILKVAVTSSKWRRRCSAKRGSTCAVSTRNCSARWSTRAASVATASRPRTTWASTFRRFSCECRTSSRSSRSTSRMC